MEYTYDTVRVIYCFSSSIVLTLILYVLVVVVLGKKIGRYTTSSSSINRNNITKTKKDCSSSCCNEFEKTLLKKNLIKKKKNINNNDNRQSPCRTCSSSSSSSSSSISRNIPSCLSTFFKRGSSNKMSSSSSLMGSSFPGSPNSDVLEVDIPKDIEGKKTLLDELKRRGRASVQSTNYKEAEHLYTKALEVSNTILDTTKDEDEEQQKKDHAILLTNRSLCRYQMGLLEGSHIDARDAATKYDSTYIKSYWRWGHSCIAQQLYDEALEAYSKGKELDPTNKAMCKEYEKTLKKVDEEKKLLNEAMNMSLEETDEKKVDGTGSSSSISKKKSTTTTSTSATKSSTTTGTTTVKPPASKKPKTPSNQNSNNEEDDDDDEDVQFSKSEIARGYKIVGNKKTSYFHNELSEEAKKLIGDIAPKKLNDVVSSNEGTSPTPAVVEGASAWNKAGTWEEKDVTQWAIKTLSDYIKLSTFTIPNMNTSGSNKFTNQVIIVSGVPTCDGHASVACVRGKKRYIYEFSLVIEWQLNFDSDQVCKGSITFPDVDGTCEGIYDMTDYKVHKDTPNEAKHILETFIKNGGLRDTIIDNINGWVQHFQSTY